MWYVLGMSYIDDETKMYNCLYQNTQNDAIEMANRCNRIPNTCWRYFVVDEIEFKKWKKYLKNEGSESTPLA